METSQLETSEIKNIKRKKAQDKLKTDLLTLAARGSAIIAEILRMKDHIPEPYINPIEEKLNKDIMFDFTYFKPGNSEKIEEKIRNSQDLSQKDEFFRENNIEVIERFYSCLFSIYLYIKEWKQIISQLEHGKYVQYTISNVISDKAYRQIYCEMLFLLGAQLLLVDRLISGPIREKILVAYYRYKGQTTIPDFQQIADLFKQTGYIPSTKHPNDCKDEIRPTKYPVEYFKRAGLDISKIEQIIGILSDSDIYEQTLAFPNDEHRVHAFANQAAMLMVILFFKGEYLDKESTKMRSIVDKYFYNNWVVSFYMGYTIDINEYWKEFKAAKKALDNALSAEELKHFQTKYRDSFNRVKKELNAHLNEGIMTEEFLLTNLEKVFNISRDANVVLRWYILQRTITNVKFKAIVNSESTLSSELINLLLDLSQFEFLLKTQFTSLIESKEEFWNNDKNKCIQKLNELIAYFSGGSSFNSVKQENVTVHLNDMVKTLTNLKCNNATGTGKKIGKIQSTLNDMSSMYYVIESDSANQNIRIINESLNHMLLLLHIKNSHIITMSQISDFSFAWINIHDYKNQMQDVLKKDPTSVLRLRATFLKLASILNSPLIRLFEIESPDIESVTNYYSGELVKFVRDILQIIPKSVFNILVNVIDTFDSGFNEMPAKIKRLELKTYSQFDKRLKLAKASHEISMFTKGIYMMDKTLMGVIEVDPKTIFEEGIRRELLLLLAKTFHTYIDFGENSTTKLGDKLDELVKRINSIKRGFIYIQDYVNINATKMWCEEMHRLMGYCADIEANKFLGKKLGNFYEKYEMSKYNIPRYEPLKHAPESLTFLGRLMRHILILTNPKNSQYFPANYTWFAKKDEVFGIKILNKLKQAIGIEGFQALGKLISYRNYQNIIQLISLYRKIKESRSLTDQLKEISVLFGSPFEISVDKSDDIKKLVASVNKFLIHEHILDKIIEIGQIELLRRLQNYSLSENTEVSAYILSSQIKSMNEMNLLLIKNDIKINFDENQINNIQPTEDETPTVFTENNYFNKLCDFFEDFGYMDTLHTFYVNLSDYQYLPLIFAVIAYDQLTTGYHLDKGGISKKSKSDDFDVLYYSYGVYILLYQMGKKNLVLFIGLIAKLMRSTMINQYSLTKDSFATMTKGNPEGFKHSALLQKFLQELAVNCGIEQDIFELNFNSYLMFRDISN